MISLLIFYQETPAETTCCVYCSDSQTSVARLERTSVLTTGNVILSASSQSPRRPLPNTRGLSSVWVKSCGAPAHSLKIEEAGVCQSSKLRCCSSRRPLPTSKGFKLLVVRHARNYTPAAVPSGSDAANRTRCSSGACAQAFTQGDRLRVR